MDKVLTSIVNDMLISDANDESPSFLSGFAEDRDSPNFSDYFFEILSDNEIPPEELCKAVDRLEINSQFLDEELICPDQRIDRFDIYGTRVSPEDLEDCD